MSMIDLMNPDEEVEVSGEQGEETEEVAPKTSGRGRTAATESLTVPEDFPVSLKQVTDEWDKIFMKRAVPDSRFNFVFQDRLNRMWSLKKEEGVWRAALEDGSFTFEHPMRKQAVWEMAKNIAVEASRLN